MCDPAFLLLARSRDQRPYHTTTQNKHITRLQQLQEGANTQATPGTKVIRRERNDGKHCDLKIGDEVTILTIGRFIIKNATVINLGSTLVTLRLSTGQKTTRKSKNLQIKTN